MVIQMSHIENKLEINKRITNKPIYITRPNMNINGTCYVLAT